MRILARLGAGLSAAALALTLAACGGNGGQAGASSSASSASTTKSSAPAASTVPHVMGMPSAPVCSVISKDDVSTLISMPVLSADDNDVLAGTQPTICDYYTNTDQPQYIEIHWMTVAQSDWATQMANLGTYESGGLKTTSTKDSVLGDDAIKGTATSDMVSTTEYQVLLKSGFVVDISNTSEPSVSDRAFLNLVKGVVQTLDKL